MSERERRRVRRARLMAQAGAPRRPDRPPAAAAAARRASIVRVRGRGRAPPNARRASPRARPPARARRARLERSGRARRRRRRPPPARAASGSRRLQRDLRPTRRGRRRGRAPTATAAPPRSSAATSISDAIEPEVVGHEQAARPDAAGAGARVRLRRAGVGREARRRRRRRISGRVRLRPVEEAGQRELRRGPGGEAVAGGERLLEVGLGAGSGPVGWRERHERDDVERAEARMDSRVVADVDPPHRLGGDGPRGALDAPLRRA